MQFPDRGLPLAWTRWELARETGWTLEYIDGLSLADIHEREQVRDGEIKARMAMRPYTSDVRIHGK